MFAIAAVSQNWGIGKDNHLLFHISADMKRFRELTEGKTVLMGRKTLQSLPGGRGLPQIKTPGGEPGVFICLGELLTMRKDGFLCGINSP